MNAPETIKLFMVRLDGGTQSRASLSDSTIDEYAEAIANGATFPPVTIFHDGDSYWLSEGFHRFHAHERAGRESIACDIRQGTRRDAVLFGAGANAEHGLRRTNEDKRRAVMTLLGDNEWREWSDREIARRCGVSQPFVSSLRPSDNGCQMAEHDGLRPTVTANGSQIDRKVERGGSVYTMNTAGIGVRALNVPAIATGLEDNRLLEAAEPQTAPAEPVEGVVECPREPTARPLRNLENLSGGDLARWVRQTTPNDRPHVIRVLRMAADILEDAEDRACNGEPSNVTPFPKSPMLSDNDADDIVF
jgi:uncharacterized ParB-like nuclease family protein